MLALLKIAFLAWLRTTVIVIQFRTASIILYLCCQAQKWRGLGWWIRNEKKNNSSLILSDFLEEWKWCGWWIAGSTLDYTTFASAARAAFSWSGTPSIPVIDATSIYLVILASWIRTTFWCNTITINCAILGSVIGGSGDQRRKWEEMEEREGERKVLLLFAKWSKRTIEMQEVYISPLKKPGLRHLSRLSKKSNIRFKRIWFWMKLG